MDTLYYISLTILILIILKVITIGGEFNFSKWIKFGGKYTKAYSHWLKLKPQMKSSNDKIKIFTPEFLKEIGFTLVSEKKSEFKPNQIYGCAKDRISLTHIYWNEDGHSCTYYGDKLEPNTSISIRKDADTRTVFNGYVFTQDDVRNILNLTL